jgi:hypothetical protein
MVITQLRNPVTRSEVFITPPVEVVDDSDYASVIQKFELICQRMWEQPERVDVTYISNLRDAELS